MILAALAPALAFILLIAAARPRCPDWRTALLAAAVVWGVVVVVVTETLSPVHALRFGALLAVWLAVDAVLAWRVWRDRRASVPVRPVGGLGLGWLDGALLLGTAVLAAMVGLVALMAPPNTYDAMTYHMSRVAHWAQNGSVEHYPTAILRQLFQPPWAEFAILQSYVLTGGDRLANLVQWFSMLGSLAAVSLVAKHLGGSRRAQILAAVVAATIPMGVVQASGTKNDYVAAFWLTCLAVFVLVLNGQPRGAPVAVWAVLVGGALGLALLTKATAFLFAAPFVVWACVARLGRDGWHVWRVMAGLVLVAVAVNAGYLARNVARWGVPFGPFREGPYAYVNASPGVRSTISVAIRNVGLHLGTPWSEVNALTDAAIRAVHRAMGLDIDDPATTWWRTHFEVSHPRRQEDRMSNGLHLALVLVAGLALLSGRRLRTTDRVTYATALVAGFVLFAAVLRWQPWHSRLQLPLFVLGAPLIGILLDRRTTTAVVIASALMMEAVVAVLVNEPRPLRAALRQPRTEQYFRARLDLRAPYTEAVRLLIGRRCAHVGLHLGGDDSEYPLWAMMRHSLPKVRLEHLVDLSVPGGHLHYRDVGPSHPCGIFATRAPERIEIRWAGLVYRRVLIDIDQGVALFLPDTAVRR
jgi:hypothetical protein